MDIKRLFFFDTEWVPIVKDYSKLSKFPKLKDAWDRRCEKWNQDKKISNESELTPGEYFELRGHWYPEFCKIICISFAYINKAGEYKGSSFYGEDEHELLSLFNNLLQSVANKKFVLCGAAIKRFDMPWVAKRMMINGLTPSKLLNVYGKKPWDVEVYDLLEVWGQGCNQESYTSFDWIAVALGIETPKGDIKGSDVKNVYYQEKNGLERIKKYCENDVEVSYKIAKRLIKLS